jgi:hypothetical protein
MSGRPGVTMIQAEGADKHLALLVEGEFQVHAGVVVRAAGEAVVLAEVHTVTATVRLRRHRRKFYTRHVMLACESVWRTD